MTADLDVLGRGWFGGETVGLTRLSISQGIRSDQLDAFLAGCIEQFGVPRIRSISGNRLCRAEARSFRNSEKGLASVSHP